MSEIEPLEIMDEDICAYADDAPPSTDYDDHLQSNNDVDEDAAAAATIVDDVVEEEDRGDTPLITETNGL